MLSSQSLLNQQAALLHFFEQSSSHDQRVLTHSVLDNAVGSGFEAARARFTRLLDDWDTSLSPVPQVAEVLRLTASGFATLEQFRQAVLDHESIDNSWLISLVLRDIAAMGRALDRACAHMILSLCTPTPLPPDPLSADLDLKDVHDLALLNANETTHTILDKHPGATLLEAGPDHMVLAFGDIDSAATINTVITGVGSSRNWDRYADRIEDMHNSVGTDATVLWFGYNAPPNIPSGLAQNPAATAGVHLHAFQDTLRTRNPDAHLTILGHSYGSVVAGQAAVHGLLAADTVIFAGSPGVPAEMQFDTPTPRLVSALSSGDLISLTGTKHVAVHGIDPSASDAFEQWRIDGTHSDYFESPQFRELLK